MPLLPKRKKMLRCEGGLARKALGRGGGKPAYAIAHFQEVANQEKVHTGFLTPVRHALAWSWEPIQCTQPEKAHAGRSGTGGREKQVTLFIAFPIGEVLGLVFRLEIKIIARVMNLML